MSKLCIAVAGSTRRMGRTLVEAVLRAEDMRLEAAFEQTGSPTIGRDAGELCGAPCGIAISDDVAEGLTKADCLIDFTRPEGTLAHMTHCRHRGVAMVIGTTGFHATQRLEIQDAARDIPITFAPNMSVGVNLIFKLLDIAARVLDQGYDVEIIEAHHHHKEDAPSGTALRMGEVVAGATGRDFSKVAVYGREGVTGLRDPATIGFATVRGGDIIGEHTVMFAGTGERVEITHRASSRMSYALGALRAARFMVGKRSGLFDMQDVLDMR